MQEWGRETNENRRLCCFLSQGSIAFFFFLSSLVSGDRQTLGKNTQRNSASGFWSDKKFLLSEIFLCGKRSRNLITPSTLYLWKTIGKKYFAQVKWSWKTFFLTDGVTIFFSSIDITSFLRRIRQDNWGRKSIAQRVKKEMRSQKVKEVDFTS